MCSHRIFSNWRYWIRPIIILIYCLFVIIIVPLLIVDSVKDGFTRKDQLILIGGLFVLTAIPISIWHIMQHVIHYTKPVLQKHIIRILWMVPIYALNAWLGLLFPEHSFYMNSLRECYEAYVIYNFMVYLLNYLNLEMDLEATLELKPPVKHIFPLCCMKPWEMGREFVYNCKHGILQYTVIRPITSIISVICELCGVYGESSFEANVAYPYIMVVNNCSQFVAMYCLVLFYKANVNELRPMNPLPKFLCIKAVVFFSFFQGVIITFLVYFGYIRNIFGSDEGDDNKNLSSKLQDFLICIEMFIAAIAHQFSFPHYPFHINIPHYDENRDWYSALMAMLDLSDVHEDVTEHLGVVSSSLSRRLRGRTTYQMTRGGDSSGGESEYLISTKSSNKNSSQQQQGYQSGVIGTNIGGSGGQPSTSSSITSKTKNRYGSINYDGHNNNNNNNNPNIINQEFIQKDGINIIKQNTIHNYSPQIVGAPKNSYPFIQQQNSNLSTTTTSSLSINNNINNNNNNINNNNKLSDNTFTTNTNTSSQLSSPTITTSSPSSSTSLSKTNNNLRNESNLTYTGDDDGGGGGGRSGTNIRMKKSDSNASDWLSTPTEEFMGIDVRGLEKHNINYKRDPNV